MRVTLIYYLQQNLEKTINKKHKQKMKKEKKELLRKKKQIKKYEKAGDYESAANLAEEIGYIRNAMILYGKLGEKQSKSYSPSIKYQGYVSATNLAEKNGLIKKALEYHEKDGDFVGDYYSAAECAEDNGLHKLALNFYKKTAEKMVGIESLMLKKAKEFSLPETALEFYLERGDVENILEVCEYFGLIGEKKKFIFSPGIKRKIKEYKKRKNNEYEEHSKKSPLIQKLSLAINDSIPKEIPNNYLKILKEEIFKSLDSKNNYSVYFKTLEDESKEINLEELNFYQRN